MYADLFTPASYYLNTLVANKRILKRSLVISMSVKMHQTAKGYLNIIELLKKSADSRLNRTEKT